MNHLPCPITRAALLQTWNFHAFRISVGLEVVQPRGVLLQQAGSCRLVQPSPHGFKQQVQVVVELSSWPAYCQTCPVASSHSPAESKHDSRVLLLTK